MTIYQIKWSPTESFEILGFPVYIYSLMFILAFLVGYNLVKSFFMKENVDEKYLDPLLIYLVLLIKIINFFLATLIGIIPQVFLVVSIGSGLEKIIEQNLEAPRIIDLIYSPDIYVPMIGFTVLIIFTIITRKIFYKK